MRIICVFLAGIVLQLFTPCANALQQSDRCYGLTQEQVSGIFSMPMTQFIATPSPQYYAVGIWRTNCSFILTGGILSILMAPLERNVTPESFKAFVKAPAASSTLAHFEMVEGVGVAAGFRWTDSDPTPVLLVMTQGKGTLILSAGGFRKLDVRPILIQTANKLIPTLRDDPWPKSDD